MDWDALERDIKKNPDKLLRERASELGVWTNAIWYACQKMRITHKKSP
jgi:transposase